MLISILVLLVATGAIAAPSVSVSQYNINEVAPLPDNGQLISSYVTDSTLELYDESLTNINILTLIQIINDLAAQPNALSDAIAVSQVIAILGEIGPGLPGDVCDSATIINAYVRAVATGTRVTSAVLNNYIARVLTNIDTLVQLATNPNGLRYVNAPLGRCIGGGRSYPLDAAWNAIIASSGNNISGLLNEEYCTVVRLSTALDVRSNNVGAAVTASSLPPVVSILQRALPSVGNLLRIISAGGNPTSAASIAKAAIRRAASST